MFKSEHDVIAYDAASDHFSIRLSAEIPKCNKDPSRKIKTCQIYKHNYLEVARETVCGKGVKTQIFLSKISGTSLSVCTRTKI